MILLYNALLVLTAFFWLPWMILRARTRKEQPNWSERAGDYHMPPGKNPKRIWIHAVSVGEVMASLPVLKALRQRLPGWEILLSTTTSSGHKTAREQAQGLFDHLVYFPIDVPRFVIRAMARVKPSVVAVMETELWMNFLWAAKEFGAATFLINGRISDRNYSRSRFVKFFYHSLLALVDRRLMQTQADAERIISLGGGKAEIIGNTKFDQAVEGLGASSTFWRNEIGAEPGDFVVVVGSSRGEVDEAAILAGLKLALPELKGAKVVWAPRHLERAPQVLAQGKAAWGSGGLRSEGSNDAFLVLDTYGELSQVYAAADAVVIGGGFDKLGGQNLIQPLGHGKPVLHGRHMHNFRQVVEQSVASGASISCPDSAALGAALAMLRESPEERQRMGEAGRALVMAGLGAGERTAEAIALAAEKVWQEKQEALEKREERRALREQKRSQGRKKP